MDWVKRNNKGGYGITNAMGQVRGQFDTQRQAFDNLLSRQLASKRRDESIANMVASRLGR